MAKVKFTDAPMLPAKVKIHKKGGAVMREYAGKPTIKVAAPIKFEDGKVYEIDDWEASWLVAHYPLSFEVVLPRKSSKQKPEEKAEE